MKGTAFYLYFMVVILCGCTYSINLVHTQGVADDVVDETQSAEPDIKTDVSLPVAT